MKRTHLFILFAIILMLTLTGCQVQDSSNTNNYGTLTGTVVDNASGLKFWDGQATIAGKTAQISNGQFQIENLPTGNHTLRVSKDHYHDKTVQVNIKNGNTMVTVEMDTIYSNAHLDLFARLVHAESRGEIYTGQVAVAASVLNRVLHHNYPNTLHGVITSRAAAGYAEYSPIDDGSINNPASENAKNAVLDALSGWDPSQGATGFFAPAKVHNRNNWVWRQVSIVQIGNHQFFRAQID